MAGLGDRLGQDLKARPARDRSGRRIPRPRRRRGDRDAVRGRSRDRTEKGARAIPPDPGAQRKSVSEATATEPAAAQPAVTASETQGWRPPSYWPFVAPAMI